MKFSKYTTREKLCFAGFLATILWGFAGWGVFRNLQFDKEYTSNTIGRVDALRHFVGGRTDAHTVYFHYAVGSIIVATSENVQAATWNSFNPGDSIPIQYRSRVPTDCRVDLPAETAHWVELPLVIGSIAFLFTAAFLVYARLYYLEHERRKKAGAHEGGHEPRLIRAIKAGWLGTRRQEKEG